MADLLTLAEVIARDPTMPDLTVRQYAALNALSHYRSVDFGDLCKRLGFYKPVLTRALSVFERQGWLTRPTDGDDHRRRTVALTSEGRAMVQRLRMAGSRKINV